MVYFLNSTVRKDTLVHLFFFHFAFFPFAPAPLLFQIKNRFNPTYDAKQISAGYRDLQLNIRIPGTDLIWELQLHLEAIEALKSRLCDAADETGRTGHQRYVVFRTIVERLPAIPKLVATVAKDASTLKRASSCTEDHSLSSTEDQSAAAKRSKQCDDGASKWRHVASTERLPPNIVLPVLQAQVQQPVDSSTDKQASSFSEDRSTSAKKSTHCAAPLAVKVLGIVSLYEGGNDDLSRSQLDEQASMSRGFEKADIQAAHGTTLGQETERCCLESATGQTPPLIVYWASDVETGVCEMFSQYFYDRLATRLVEERASPTTPVSTRTPMFLVAYQDARQYLEGMNKVSADIKHNQLRCTLVTAPTAGGEPGELGTTETGKRKGQGDSNSSSTKKPREG